MSDRDALDLASRPGHRLSLDAYRSDFRRYRDRIRGRESWKFERRQEFEEDGESWQALRRGDRAESVRLLEDEREDLLAAARRDRQRGTPFRRVRVVEEPLTPYMRWELYALRVQAEAGKDIRVVRPGVLGTLEPAGPLPEVVVLGGQVLYEVIYTDAGALDGAVRHHDADLIRRWEAFIRALHEAGEDILSYVARSPAIPE